ncbi:ExeM/NucH family extracellular endonuclease [Actinomyces urogenitalis]|uniref:ExeM/NucH family extracellular endonuclease n=1 Tax=Actinomyces urogenitalis TaxID=103621 RepID=UPI00242BD440|nr:ExeM/NucH family extracellular endonuclease [Actinomyces urogenitalis]MCI7455863.1 ExeM/NucH family extracellular endonuclease [Actinomyces urogenitalis]
MFSASARPRAERRRLQSWSGALAASVLALTGAGLALPATAHAAPDGSGLVISEVYTSGGSAGAAYQDKFVELANPTGADLALEGLSLQYRSPKQSAPGLASNTCALSGTVRAGSVFVIAVGKSNGTAGQALSADATCAATNPGAKGGVFALVRASEKHTFTIGSLTGDPEVLDLVGWGSSPTFEGAVVPQGEVAQSYQRAGTTDTNDNAADFTPAAPTPGAVEGLVPAGPGGEGAGSEPGGEGPATPSDPGGTSEPGQAGALTTIAQIQGAGATTPLAGQVVTTRGVVTAVYPTGGIKGYYIQTPGSGGGAVSAHASQERAAAASQGLFIYDGAGATTLTAGQCVEVTGTAGEYNGLTQLSKVTATTPIANCAPVSAVEVPDTAWLATDAAKEAYEGMLLRPTGAWTVTNNYATNQYGRVGLAAGEEPLYQATDVVAPGQAAKDYEAANLLKEIDLDDGSKWNYMSSAEAKASALPYLTASTSLRAGDAVTFTSDVILDQRKDGTREAIRWRLQPLTQVTGLQGSPISWRSSRAAAPTVGGALTVTSFNVLNYFTDLGQDEAGCKAYTDRQGNKVTANGCQVRGAYSQAAFEQQQAKIVAAINELDSSVVGLEEIENAAKFGHDRDASLAALVTALNTAAGSTKWAYVPSPASRPQTSVEDVIRTAFIYQPALVSPVGESVILDDPAFTGIARQPLAQEFAPAEGAGTCQVGGQDVRGRSFVAVVNHFKSKGSGSGAGNADTGDGQGASNAARVAQATALTAGVNEQWADRPVFLLGDFNSYSQEDPVKAMEAAGYTLIDEVVDNVGHTYQFGGRIGSLDHVLVNEAAAAMVVGAKVWDVNADESVAYEYSRAGYNVAELYAADAYRSSDHDPVKVGLRLVAEDGQACAAPGEEEPGTGVPTASPAPGTPTATATATSSAGAGRTSGTGGSGAAVSATGSLARTGVGLGGVALALALTGLGGALAGKRRR